MLAALRQSEQVPDEAALTANARHLLIVLPAGKALEGPAVATLRSLLERRKLKPDDLAKTPVAATLANGTLCAWVRLDPARSVFERGTALRKALAPLLEESPAELAIALYGNAAARAAAAPQAAYTAWVNGARLPVRKKKSEAASLASIRMFGSNADVAEARAVAEANVLCRELTALPPNELTPRAYRARVRAFAKAGRLGLAEYDLPRLRRMGAGAFVAVAQGSAEPDAAAIVRLRYAPRGAKRRIALVGKGICFDTGGHNLKPARYMAGMHHDMNGSAVALGIVQAAARLKLPVRIDAWLAIAQNDIGPRAYRQSEVVTALNGTTIEIVHTDAEGRMVLADALALAVRDKPEVIVDFATLTGSMIHALGNRYSGVFANRPELARTAVAAGEASGERVCVFPMDEDYESALESKIADVKQCTLEGEADHILAARFLARFVSDTPWVHLDIAAATCTDGLGAVGTEITGFGVAWGAQLVRRIADGTGS